jgi:hypothetical protein
MSKRPPLPIALSDQQLKAIGETCAILGQIDMFMQETVAWLLNVPFVTAATILGSTDARARVSVFKTIIDTKCEDVRLKAQSAEALKRFQKLSEQRNDFIHAYFAVLTRGVRHGVIFEGIHFAPHDPSGPGPSGTPIAVKVRTRKHQPSAFIEQVRDDAAEAAHLFQRIATATFEKWSKAQQRPSQDKS